MPMGRGGAARSGQLGAETRRRSMPTQHQSLSIRPLIAVVRTLIMAPLSPAIRGERPRTGSDDERNAKAQGVDDPSVYATRVGSGDGRAQRDEDNQPDEQSDVEHLAHTGLPVWPLGLAPVAQDLACYQR